MQATARTHALSKCLDCTATGTHSALAPYCLLGNDSYGVDSLLFTPFTSPTLPTPPTPLTHSIHPLVHSITPIIRGVNSSTESHHSRQTISTKVGSPGGPGGPGGAWPKLRPSSARPPDVNIHLGAYEDHVRSREDREDQPPSRAPTLPCQIIPKQI